MRRHHLRMRVALLLASILAASAVHAQKPVYLCGKVYTDQPCKDGREVDIAPTRGAHSMSGQRRESTEAAMEGISRNTDAALKKGMREGAVLMRCGDLQRQRAAIDGQRARRSAQGSAARDSAGAVSARLRSNLSGRTGSNDFLLLRGGQGRYGRCSAHRDGASIERCR